MSLATLDRSPSVSDEQQYRLICAATLPFFLFAAVTQRAWRMGRRPPATRSILAEARAANANALLIAFQG